MVHHVHSCEECQKLAGWFSTHLQSQITSSIQSHFSCRRRKKWFPPAPCCGRWTHERGQTTFTMYTLEHRRLEWRSRVCSSSSLAGFKFLLTASPSLTVPPCQLRSSSSSSASSGGSSSAPPTRPRCQSPQTRAPLTHQTKKKKNKSVSPQMETDLLEWQ